MLSVLSRYIARLLLARTLILLAGLAALMVILEFLADGDQVLAASGERVAAGAALHGPAPARDPGRSCCRSRRCSPAC